MAIGCHDGLTVSIRKAISKLKDSCPPPLSLPYAQPPWVCVWLPGSQCGGLGDGTRSERNSVRKIEDSQVSTEGKDHMSPWDRPWHFTG